MGGRVDLIQMLGLPFRVECPKCGNQTESGHGGVTPREVNNPATGKWVLSQWCDKCEHEWYIVYMIKFTWHNKIEDKNIISDSFLD